MKFSRILVELFAGVCLIGLVSCFSRFENEMPAEHYPGIDADVIGACPDIEGVYKDEGDFTCSVDNEHCGLPTRSIHGEHKGQWVGSISLTQNLTGIRLITSDFISPTELIQPDENTLIVVQSDSRYTLKRDKGDFECEDGGLVISSGQYSIYKEVATVIAFFALTWLFESYTQTFKPHEDGSLTMTVKESAQGFHVFIGAILEAYYFVHWVPADAKEKKNGEE